MFHTIKGKLLRNPVSTKDVVQVAPWEPLSNRRPAPSGLAHSNGAMEYDRTYDSKATVSWRRKRPFRAAQRRDSTGSGPVTVFLASRRRSSSYCNLRPLMQFLHGAGAGIEDFR